MAVLRLTTNLEAMMLTLIEAEYTERRRQREFNEAARHPRPRIPRRSRKWPLPHRAG